MAKIVDLAEYRNRKKKKQDSGPNEANIESARERDAGWQVFSRTVRGAKNNRLTGKQAAAVLKLLIGHFKIKDEEIKIDDLIRAEFAGHLPDPDCLAESGDDIVFSLARAIQQNQIDLPQAVRIIKVINVWYRIDIEK